MDLYQALFSINPRATWPGTLGLLLFAVAAAIAVGKPPAPGSRCVRAVKYFCVAALLAVLPLHAGVLLDYLVYPGYLDHIEANVAAVSWLGWEGHPLYPVLGTGDMYGIPYGPILYQASGFTLWLLGPSVASSKVLGIGAFVLSQILSFVLLKRSGAAVLEALAITAAQCALQAGFTSQGYAGGVRSDALIFLAAETAMLAATTSVGSVNAIALGLLGGAIVNLKIHGGLYVLPGFAYFISRAERTGRRARLVAIAAVAGIAALILPFLPQNVSISDYFSYFEALSHHPWDRWTFEKNVVLAAFILAPLGSTYACCGRRAPPKFGVFLPALVVSTLLMTVPAAERGAGPYHLLPFLPSVCWGFSMLRRAASSGLQENRRSAGICEGITVALIVALVFGYGPIAAISWGRSLVTFAHAALLREGVAEIDDAIAKHPGMTLAVGPGLASLDVEGLRVIPVFHGNPLPVDSAAWMTSQLDGVSDAGIRRAIRSCRIGLWLVPAGPPFAAENLYTKEELYSDQVRADFHANYRVQKSGRVFDQWRCTRDEAGTPPPDATGRQR